MGQVNAVGSGLIETEIHTRSEHARTLKRPAFAAEQSGTAFSSRSTRIASLGSVGGLEVTARQEMSSDPGAKGERRRLPGSLPRVAVREHDVLTYAALLAAALIQRK